MNKKTKTNKLTVRNFVLDSKDKTEVTNYTKYKFFTKVLNSISLLFPVGEKYFCIAVREHESKLQDNLKEEVSNFYKQEGRHSLAHINLNKKLLPKTAIESVNEQVQFRLDKYSSTPESKLLITCGMEVLTGFGAVLLNKFGKCVLLDNTYCNLWKYHAIEEEEHKATAWDVYKACYGSGICSYGKLIKYTAFGFKEIVGQARINYKILSEIQCK